MSSESSAHQKINSNDINAFVLNPKMTTTTFHDTPLTQAEIQRQLNERNAPLHISKASDTNTQKIGPAQVEKAVSMTELEKRMKERAAQMFTVPNGQPPPAPLKM